ncbi:MAG: methyltransferase domain-containing protein, partial [Patescibacteria group bacterium]|nr:methyltransferase domain-containing protein [Patescibacteria group bacterium]
YTALTYLDTHLLHARPTYIAYTNRVFIRIFIFLKKHANRFKNHRRVPAHTDPLSRIFGPLTTVIDETDKQPRESNIRYYHLLKGAHVFSFLKQYASPEKYFLDAGAGRGPYCMLASPLFKNVTCWEYNENELAHARKACARFSNISYARVDLRNTPAYDGSFDVIVCSEVLEHIPEREQAVRELRRLLRPGGTLLVSMPNSWSLFYLRVRIVHRALLKKKLSPGDPDWEFIQHLLFPFWKIEKLLKNGGFQIIRRSGVNILPISEKIRTRLTERYPKIAFIYLVIERSLSRICPFFCSFYFLTLQ